MRDLLAREKVVVNCMCFAGASVCEESSCDVGVEDLGLIPGLVRSPAGRHGNPLQYSCLKNPHEQRSMAATVHGVTRESDTTGKLSTAQQNFMRKLDWATDSDFQLKIISGCNQEAISGRTDICIGRLSKADCPPQCGQASATPLKAQIEQKAKQERILSVHLTPFKLEISLLLPLDSDSHWNLHHQVSCFSGLRSQPGSPGSPISQSP